MFIELGRLTQDVEVRTVSIEGVDKHVMNNRLAVRVSAGSTAFMDITAWNGSADFIGQHFKKGDELLIEGELRSRAVKTEGREFSHPFILVTRVRFTHGNRREDGKGVEAENAV
jgi:single-stranded DNA-binding protein